MSLDPVQHARTVVNHLGAPLIAGALRSYPRSLETLRLEHVIVPALAIAAIAVCTGLGLEQDGLAHAGATGLLVGCLAFAVASRAWFLLHEERLLAAWLVSQGLSRGWLAAVGDGASVQLVERSGETYATLRASHPCAAWVVAGFAPQAVARAAA